MRNQRPAALRCGLSPRVRGKPHQPMAYRIKWGSIPACAGETAGNSASATPDRVYPRVCGGNFSESPRASSKSGLSPRVRGKRSECPPGRNRWRSIPACAGETLSPPGARAASRVYPRVCGGNAPCQQQLRQRRGLSPRVRGKPAVAGTRAQRCGSIPACAGETRSVKAMWTRRPVYPRVCGGNAMGYLNATIGAGLSPRVRGKRRATGGIAGVTGSIPACAGETAECWIARRPTAVYPRVCGGNTDGFSPANRGRGLSPRVRGKPNRRAWCSCTARSIPACAGETYRPQPRGAGRRVYPRVCGGNACW